AEWGEWYYAVSNSNGLTHMSGADGDVHSKFTSTGALDNSADPKFRAINDRYPVFGLSVNYGSVGTSAVNSVFSLFLSQRDSIQFDGTGGGVQPVQILWATQYANDLDVLSALYGNFRDVYNGCVSLDSKVTTDAVAAGGQDYLTIVSLAIRQMFAAFQVAGTTATPYIFMDEISSNGNMNTVDVIYPLMPAMLYLNPSWFKLLLDPIFQVQYDDQWPQPYAIHDIGLHFPNATRHPDGVDGYYPLEECGNMVIMALAYAQRTGNTGYLSQHYALLRQWTGFLVDMALIPANQISTDDFAGALANQTDLALKGIIGIQAMSIISTMTGNAADGANFSSIATYYIAQWQTLGIAQNANPPHATLSYGQNDTNGLLYNLYADALVQTHLVPRSVYEIQSNFYPTVANEYGVPLDTRHVYLKNDWEMWCAAISSADTRNIFIGTLAKWIGATTTGGPVTDLFDTVTGGYAQQAGLPAFQARPVVGGWFSLLALNATGIPA
ncbi:hypothetical protein LTR95_012581, partial [Oleoguttula sp. CCFEE 5521]